MAGRKRTRHGWVWVDDHGDPLDPQPSPAATSKSDSDTFGTAKLPTYSTRNRDDSDAEQ